MTKKIKGESAWELAIYMYEKMSFIENQIKSLEKIKEIYLISISVFLIKTQYIEFQIKWLIFSLDRHILLSNSSSLIRPQLRSPKDLESDGVKMIGQTIRELEKYNGSLLKVLIKNLKKINKERIIFTHKLYDSNGTVEELHAEARKGILLANETIEEIKNIEKLLEKEA